MAMKRKTGGSRGKRSGPIADRGLYGEGNYQATRDYNAATRRFVGSGRVAEAARRAAPSSSGEAASLERAERAGKRRAKGEDRMASPDRRSSRSR